MNDNQQSLVTKAAVLSVATMLYTNNMAGPALGAIKQAFPNASSVTIQQIISIPAIMMIFGSLVTAQLQRVMPKKKILYIGILIQIVAGITPAFYGDMTFILIVRTIFGLGFGMTFPLASSLIADLFDGKERDTLMGYKSSVGAAAGVLFQMLGGYLAAIDWRYNFLGLLVLIPVYLLVMFKMPEPEKRPPVKSTGANFGGLTSKTWLIYLFNIVFNILQFSFVTNAAIVMAATKAGGPAQAGVVLTTFTGGAFVAGILYSRVLGLFKAYTLALSTGLLGIAFTVLVNADSYSLYIVGSALFGLGFGLYNPEITIRTIKSAHKSAATLAMSFFVASMGVGKFGAPFLVYASQVLGFQGPKASWMVVAPTFFIVCVLLILRNVFAKSKNITEPAA
ncbi:MFS transporter [Sporomusa sp.]|jgi:MFS family permease|uniref:MFS transporter n=1 Tax=Sporomusa sp. TaxID=2078658 RepID=UPI002BCF2A8F|nr:MFS transporter [Sporomusa sp.]MDF2876088.1 arabinose efflux permease [Sporomusa sp.]HWR06314.1 MFS transporter [Sporomusa sp.]